MPRLQINLLLFFSAFLASSSFGQIATLDTTRLNKILEMEQYIDSLRTEMRLVEKELQQVKVDMANGSNFEKFLAALNDENEDNIPEDQRSRRRRVDALLKAITQRPGQLRFNGSTTTIFQASEIDGKHITTVSGSFDIFAATSFGPNTLLFFDLESIGGDGMDPHIPNLVTLNADAGSTHDLTGHDRMHVLEAWAEFTALNESINITAGKIDLTNYFDNNAAANDETAQFYSGVFVNSSALLVPAVTPGIRLRTTMFNRFFLQLGFSSLDNSGDNIFNEIYKIGSVGFKVLPNTDWEGNLRVYGYSHPLIEKDRGYGLSFDQTVMRMFTIFARYGKNQPQLANLAGIQSAWSAGTRFVQTFTGRRFVVGLAYGESQLPLAGGTEQVFEGYARQQLNKWTFISPHFQALKASDRGDFQYIWGLRTQFNF